METKGLKVGDKCTVHVEWAETTDIGRVQIGAFQQNGNTVFARVIYARDGVNKEEKFGILFALTELKKIV